MHDHRTTSGRDSLRPKASRIDHDREAHLAGPRCTDARMCWTRTRSWACSAPWATAP